MNDVFLSHQQKYGTIWGYVLIESRKKSFHLLICRSFRGATPCLFVADKELAKRITATLAQDFFRVVDAEASDKIESLMTSFMEPRDWKKHRLVFTKSLSSIAIKSHYSTITTVAREWKLELDKIATSTCELNPRSFLHKILLDVMSRCFLKTRLDTKRITDDQMEVFFLANANAKSFILSTLLPSWARNYFDCSIVRKKAKDFFIRDTDNWTKIGHLLSKSLGPTGTLSHLAKGELDLKYWRIALTMQFMAGGESIPAVLAWTLYYLALNHHIQDEIVAEIKSFDSSDVETILKSQLIDCVINESMRLSPPFLGIMRVAEKDCQVNGIKIDRGTMIAILINNIHRNPDYYSNPDKFDPHRFMSDSGGKNMTGAFLPFGKGLRKCPGFKFAYLVMKVLLIEIIKNFQISTSPKTPKKPAHVDLWDLETRPDFLLKLERRFLQEA